MIFNWKKRKKTGTNNTDQYRDNNEDHCKESIVNSKRQVSRLLEYKGIKKKPGYKMKYFEIISIKCAHVAFKEFIRYVPVILPFDGFHP